MGLDWPVTEKEYAEENVRLSSFIAAYEGTEGSECGLIQQTHPGSGIINTWLLLHQMSPPVHYPNKCLFIDDETCCDRSDPCYGNQHKK